MKKINETNPKGNKRLITGNMLDIYYKYVEILENYPKIIKKSTNQTQVIEDKT